VSYNQYFGLYCHNLGLRYPLKLILFFMQLSYNNSAGTFIHTILYIYNNQKNSIGQVHTWELVWGLKEESKSNLAIMEPETLANISPSRSDCQITISD